MGPTFLPTPKEGPSPNPILVCIYPPDLQGFLYWAMGFTGSWEDGKDRRLLTEDLCSSSDGGLLMVKPLRAVEPLWISTSVVSSSSKVDVDFVWTSPLSIVRGEGGVGWGVGVCGEESEEKKSASDGVVKLKVV